MVHLVESLSQFLVFIGIGTVLFLPVVSLKETGVGFGKLILSVCFGSFITASLMWAVSSMTVSTSVIYFSFFILFSFVVFNHFSLSKSETTKLFNKVSYFIFLFISLLLVYTYAEGSLIESIFYISSILFVGCSVFLMLLGHYYLVVPKLSERPLIILHYLLWTILVVKLMMSTYSYFTWPETNQNLWDTVFVAMRALWGYLAILVLSYFSFRLSKMRSTQSATGILYVVVFFMIVGELVSYYLFNSKGLLI